MIKKIGCFLAGILFSICALFLYSKLSEATLLSIHVLPDSFAEGGEHYVWYKSIPEYAYEELYVKSTCSHEDFNDLLMRHQMMELNAIDFMPRIMYENEWWNPPDIKSVKEYQGWVKGYHVQVVWVNGYIYLRARR